MKKLIYLPALIFLFLFTAGKAAGPLDDVAALIKQGDAKGLAELLSTSTVDLNIAGAQGLYSKKDASKLISDFFAAHKPQGLKILHKVNSNPSVLYSVMLLNTDNGNFRVSVALKGDAGSMKIIELQIEAEKN